MASKRLVSSAVGLFSRAGISPSSAKVLSSAPLGRLSTVVNTQGPFYMSTARRMHGQGSKMPEWMHGSVHNPEVLFRNLSVEDKDVVRLLQLMLLETVEKVENINQDGVNAVKVELAKMSDRQKDIKRSLQTFLFVVGFAFSTAQTAANKVKSQSLQVAENLASNSEEIVADLVAALKHGMTGGGKPFVWKNKWLEKKVPEDPTSPTKPWYTWPWGNQKK